MPQQSRTTLERYFKSGSKVSVSQYVDLIDSFYSLIGDDSDVLPDAFQRTLLVDINASAGTGERGKINSPFSTIEAAKAAAVGGDTIVIFPGTYQTSNMYSAGVTYLAMPGVTIIPDGSSEPGKIPALFSDFVTGDSGLCSLYGQAVIDLQNESALVNTSSMLDIEIVIECQSILDHNATLVTGLINGLLKSLTIVTNRIECNSPSAFINATGFSHGTVFSITANEVIANNGVSFARIFGARADFRLTNMSFISATDVPIFLAQHESNTNIYDTHINTNVSQLAVRTPGGSMRMENMRLITSSEFGGSLAIIGTALVYFTIFKNCEIIETGTPTGRYCIEGNGVSSQIIGVLNTNMPKDPLLEIYVGEFNYDTALNNAS